MTLGLLTLIWAAVGFGYSATLTPSGRLLTRSAHPEDRPAVFAAQFTLSHACWLVFYPLAGWLMTRFGATVHDRTRPGRSWACRWRLGSDTRRAKQRT